MLTCCMELVGREMAHTCRWESKDTNFGTILRSVGIPGHEPVVGELLLAYWRFTRRAEGATWMGLHGGRAFGARQACTRVACLPADVDENSLRHTSWGILDHHVPSAIIGVTAVAGLHATQIRLAQRKLLRIVIPRPLKNKYMISTF